MKRSVDHSTGKAQVRLEQDQPAARAEHATALSQCRARIAQVMKHVEQDQVRALAILEAQGVGVFDLVDPRIRKEVGANAAWNDFANVADSGTELDDLSAHGWIDVLRDALVELAIRAPQYRLAVPVLQVAFDLDIMLIDTVIDLVLIDAAH